jgi:hypothetical protein
VTPAVSSLGYFGFLNWTDDRWCQLCSVWMVQIANQRRLQKVLLLQEETIAWV